MTFSCLLIFQDWIICYHLIDVKPYRRIFGAENCFAIFATGNSRSARVTRVAHVTDCCRQAMQLLLLRSHLDRVDVSLTLHAVKETKKNTFKHVTT